ncbi:MAG: glycosyltransferase family 39 protein [Candidatus Margulisiibacteriota bacterium]
MKLSDFQKGLVIVLTAFVVLGGLLFINRVLLGDAFAKEEAQHALYGLALAKDVRALDLSGFWYDTQRQMFWPFLHSWVLSVFFLCFGVSYFSARFLSFAMFFATLLITYLVSVKFCDRQGWRIGALACVLALTSPLMARFGTENTLEGLGALIFMAAFYFYILTEEKKLTVNYLILAVLLGLSIYTNYLYAYLMVPAFIVMTLGKLGPLGAEVVTLSKKGEKAAVPFFWWAYRKLVVIGVLAVLIAAWFFTSTFNRKIMLLLQAIFRYSGGEQVAGIGNILLYYPRAIISHFSFSPWLGLLMVISLFLPWVAFRFPKTGKLYTFVWTALLLATLTVPTKAPQFIYIIAPFVFIIFAATVFYLLEKYQRAAAAGLVVILLPALIWLPQLGGLYQSGRSGERMIQVLGFFRGNILPRYPIAAGMNLQRLNPEGIAFHFWDWNAPVLADPIVGEAEMFRAARYFLAVELDPAIPYTEEVLDDSVHRWNSFLREKSQLGEIKEELSQSFPGLGLVARIYVKSR